jgi:hypothetical protein
MSLDLSLEIWEALRPHIAGGFQEAADDFVVVLTENMLDPVDINEYNTDPHIKKSLLDYIDVEDYEEEEDAFGGIEDES